MYKRSFIQEQENITIYDWIIELFIQPSHWKCWLMLYGGIHSGTKLATVFLNE